MRRDLLCRKSEIYRFSSSCRTDANHYRNATADHFTRQVHHLDAFLEGQGVLLTRGSADHNAVDPEPIRKSTTPEYASVSMLPSPSNGVMNGVNIPSICLRAPFAAKVQNTVQTRSRISY